MQSTENTSATTNDKSSSLNPRSMKAPAPRCPARCAMPFSQLPYRNGIMPPLPDPHKQIATGVFEEKPLQHLGITHIKYEVDKKYPVTGNKGQERRTFLIIIGIVLGIIVLIAASVGVLYAVGVLGGKGDPKEHDVKQSWKEIVFSSNGYANMAWCPQGEPDCQENDYSSTATFDYVYVDMFDTNAETIEELKTKAVVICYISGGSFEDDRPDSMLFPPASLGQILGNWPDEKYFDIRPEQPHYDQLKTIMAYRASLAAQKGCQAVEWDNVDCWQNQCIQHIFPGDQTMAANQIIWNRFLAEITHKNGMSAGLKNDIDQIEELVDDFDFAINENCFAYDECDLMLPFIEQGKAVMLAIDEYYGLDYHLACEYSESNNMMPLLAEKGGWMKCP
eukprot:CFRG0163T1